jgi:hypothetical protein
MKKSLFDKPEVNQVNKEAADNFVDSSQVKSKPSNQPKTSQPAKSTADKFDGFPWNAPEVRSDLDVNVLVALKEDTKIKLKWLADNNHIKSMRSFSIDALTRAVNKEVKKHT